MTSQRSATIVGKGPSAKNATEFVCKDPTTIVVTLNDSARLLDDTIKIDYGFFTDVEMIERAKPYLDRTATIVLPSALHKGGTRSDLTWRDVLTKPYSFCVNEVEYDVNHTPSIGYLQERIKLRGIIHQSTSTLAHSYLLSLGCPHIRLIGIDGGSDYAPGASGLRPVEPISKKPANYTRWRYTHEEIDRISKKLHGVRTTWGNV